MAMAGTATKVKITAAMRSVRFFMFIPPKL